MIRFAHRDRSLSVDLGESYAAPSEQGFRDTQTADLLDLVNEINSGRSWRAAVQERYATSKPWLHRIISESRRTAFFANVLPPNPGLCLEIGAGWGQVCRALATHHDTVALEPVAERLAFIQAAAKQDGVASRLACIAADYFDIRFDTRFDTICAIGVLEWVGAFQNHTDPQERQRKFLGKVRAELASGGCFVIGIENRLGLKYLLGCPDDHIGVPHIACLPATLARQRWQKAGRGDLQAFTYSLPELRDMLQTAGFPRIDFFAAFPDYKLPEQIIPIGDTGSAVNDWLASNPIPTEHNGYDGNPMSETWQSTLAKLYRKLAAGKQAHHFAPSFFVRACAG